MDLFTWLNLFSPEKRTNPVEKIRHVFHLCFVLIAPPQRLRLAMDCASPPAVAQPSTLP